MNGRHPEPDRSVPSQTIYIRTGQQRAENRGCHTENPNGPQMPPPQSFGNEAKQAQEHAQGLFGRWYFGNFSVVALGQRISRIPHASAEGFNYLNKMPFMRKVAVFLSMLAVFSIAFHSGEWWFKEPPEDLILSAQASETVKTNQRTKTDKDGFFLEDCY